MTHFLDVAGRLVELPARARGLADHLGAIVAALTSQPAGVVRGTVVRCRRRPGRRPCVGQIEGIVKIGSGEIAWRR